MAVAETVGEEQIAQRLIAAGVFPTKQRLDVGLVILAKPQHLSADQIIAGIREMGSRVSKATVYNTRCCSASAGCCAPSKWIRLGSFTIDDRRPSSFL